MPDLVVCLSKHIVGLRSLVVSANQMHMEEVPAICKLIDTLQALHDCLLDEPGALEGEMPWWRQWQYQARDAP